jgi:hypothetical protein
MTPEMAEELVKITEKVWGVTPKLNVEERMKLIAVPDELSKASTNPPSSPPPTDTAEKLYLQIRICAEQYTGSKYVKKEYQIELPANVVGLDGEAGLSRLDYPNGTWVQLAIPVILQAPSSSSPEEVTPTAQWQETNRYEKDGKTFVRSDRFIPG